MEHFDQRFQHILPVQNEQGVASMQRSLLVLLLFWYAHAGGLYGS
jgi:hypothetical protein